MNIYKNLAWIEPIIAPPEEYEAEVERYVKVLKDHASTELKTMLHLGCGAGGHDSQFKKHFEVTGVDISEGMLNVAKENNTEITYLHGDMRTVDLNRQFDIVAIPDSIMYMNTVEDLHAAIQTAAKHVKPGGLMFFVIHTKEDFQNNNFSYTAEKGDIHDTILESNHINSDNTYEATMIYLLRENGKLSIHHDVHLLGLFSHKTWEDALATYTKETIFVDMNDLYDANLLEEGEYKLKMVISKC
ncbi:class I SAM-dependent DNA methyltransferase [Alkalihalophilus marmarensis]|uniref:class I SAM-dependent DNA methyltransferase n=1 Tax=Alkalihalophilus marmarensis TaxID=521377 RepID=UPI002DBE30F6|nr:class I SAM-dependent methyltransferase [Alkalihalophilus marmarensis]MEC2070999.1 class I SAM-dependent methyltransferase [Alkalihalophilus marmarensis]